MIVFRRLCSKVSPISLTLVECLRRKNTYLIAVAFCLHWCKSTRIGAIDKPERVVENDQIKTIWDFKIQADRVLEATKKVGIVIDKEAIKFLLTNVNIPDDLISMRLKFSNKVISKLK